MLDLVDRVFKKPPSKFKSFTGAGNMVFERISCEITHDATKDVRTHYASLLDPSWDAHANHVRMIKQKGPQTKDEQDPGGGSTEFNNACDHLIDEFEDINDIHAFITLIRRIADQRRMARHYISQEVVDALNIDRSVLLKSDDADDPGGHHVMQTFIAALWGASAAMSGGKAKAAAVGFAIVASLLGSYEDTASSTPPEYKLFDARPWGITSI